MEAAGYAAPHVMRPAGLTEREAEVVAMLARGLQTKQVARALGISLKAADRHIQNAYRKIGVSTRVERTCSPCALRMRLIASPRCGRS